MIYLREVKETDAYDLYPICSNDNVTKTLNWYSHESIYETRFVITNFYLKKHLEGIPNSYAIVYKETDRVIGIIDFFKERGGINVGYYLSDQYWGLGIMTLALKMILNIGFNELGYKEIIIGHFDDNIGSKKVILKNGFKYDRTYKEIVKGEIKTILIYKLSKGDYNEKQS